MKKVLIVDDQLGIRFFLQEYFCENDEVQTASNGKLALEAFKQQPCDLLVTDIKMPKMNGLDLIAELRRLDPQLKIIAMTAYDEDGILAELKRLKVDGILMKPFGIEDVQAMENVVMGYV